MKKIVTAQTVEEIIIKMRLQNIECSITPINYDVMLKTDKLGYYNNYVCNWLVRY